jgi:hypothetical protein
MNEKLITVPIIMGFLSPVRMMIALSLKLLACELQRMTQLKMLEHILSIGKDNLIITGK